MFLCRISFSFTLLPRIWNTLYVEWQQFAFREKTYHYEDKPSLPSNAFFRVTLRQHHHPGLTYVLELKYRHQCYPPSASHLSAHKPHRWHACLSAFLTSLWFSGIGRLQGTQALFYMIIWIRTNWRSRRSCGLCMYSCTQDTPTAVSTRFFRLAFVSLSVRWGGDGSGSPFGVSWETGT